MSLAVAGRKRQEVQTGDCTSSGRVFQKMGAACERAAGTCSCSVNDDRRQRQPGRLDTGTSVTRWYCKKTAKYVVEILLPPGESQ